MELVRRTGGITSKKKGVEAVRREVVIFVYSAVVLWGMKSLAGIVASWG